MPNSLPDEKVTKESPRAAPFGIPQCEVPALFALAALRSGSRRATFCHRKRPICHFEFVGESVFVVSFGFDEEKYSAFNPWRRGVLVARWDATFCSFRGIGEGGMRLLSGVFAGAVDRFQEKAGLIKCNDRYKTCYAEVIPGV